MKRSSITSIKHYSRVKNLKKATNGTHSLRVLCCLGFFASEFRELSAALFKPRTGDEAGDEEGVLPLETTDGLPVE